MHVSSPHRNTMCFTSKRVDTGHFCALTGKYPTVEKGEDDDVSDKLEHDREWNENMRETVRRSNKTSLASIGKVFFFTETCNVLKSLTITTNLVNTHKNSKRKPWPTSSQQWSTWKNYFSARTKRSMSFCPNFELTLAIPNYECHQYENCTGGDDKPVYFDVLT